MVNFIIFDLIILGVSAVLWNVFLWHWSKKYKPKEKEIDKIMMVWGGVGALILSLNMFFQ